MQAEHDYRRGLRTVFVWEAVTRYLDERAVRATFDFRSGAVPGTAPRSTAGRRLPRVRARAPVVLAPEEVEGILAPYGWAEVALRAGLWRNTTATGELLAGGPSTASDGRSTCGCA